MFQNKSPYLFNKIDQAEYRLCAYINHYSRKLPVRAFFRVVSRLGDGVFWYAVILLLPILHGAQGLKQLIHVSAVGLVSVLLYKVLKAFFIRERPYISFGTITAETKPLDKYSFPSGHSMNAACMAIVLSICFPELSFVLTLFAGLVGISRVILGMHYPSDVIIGLILGSGVAYTCMAIWPLPV